MTWWLCLDSRMGGYHTTTIRVTPFVRGDGCSMWALHEHAMKSTWSIQDGMQTVTEKYSGKGDLGSLMKFRPISSRNPVDGDGSKDQIENIIRRCLHFPLRFLPPHSSDGDQIASLRSQ